MSKKLSKQESERYLEEFFSSSESKAPKEVKKMLQIAMSRNIKLKEKRKLFCKKCYTMITPKAAQIRIKKGMKTVKCLKCNALMRWKIGD